jgi:hypothetical protein
MLLRQATLSRRAARTVGGVYTPATSVATVVTSAGWTREEGGQTIQLAAVAKDSYTPDDFSGAGYFWNNGAQFSMDHDTVILTQVESHTKFRRAISIAGDTQTHQPAPRACILGFDIPSPSDMRKIVPDGTLSSGEGTAVLDAYSASWVFEENILPDVNGPPEFAPNLYPSGNWYPALTSDVEFADLANAATDLPNLALDVTSPYKAQCANESDPGANVAFVKLATSGVKP